MIESRVVYRNDLGRGAGQVLILGTRFKDKLVHTSVAVGHSDGSRLPVEVVAARHALQIYSGCVTAKDYCEIPITTLVSVPVIVHETLQRAENEHAVLFLAATIEIQKSILRVLNSRL